MALWWPEAKMMVEFSEATMQGDSENYPKDTLVITMREDQIDDPQLIEAMRHLVLARMMMNRRSLMDELINNHLDRMAPKEGQPSEVVGERAAAAEKHFEEIFCAETDRIFSDYVDELGGDGCEGCGGSGFGYDDDFDSPAPLINVTIHNCGTVSF